jgi:hypothetical protein
MRHPLEAAIPPEQRRNVLLAFLALSATLFGVVFAVGADLKTDKAIHGIVSFQLAGEPLVSQSILYSWQLKGAFTKAQIVLSLDYALLLVYSTTLALGCVWASKLWGARGIARIGVWLGWGQWAAGAFNAVQDYALLRILWDWSQAAAVATPIPPPPLLATETARLCALAKFGLIEAGLLYIAISGIHHGLGELRLRVTAQPAA